MAIKIKVERIMDCNFNKEYRIIDISCLKKNKLPKAYLSGQSPIVYMTENNVVVLKNIKEDIPNLIYIGAIFWERDFKAILRHIKQAGEHLYTVNNWKNEETFII